MLTLQDCKVELGTRELGVQAVVVSVTWPRAFSDAMGF